MTTSAALEWEDAEKEFEKAVEEFVSLEKEEIQKKQELKELQVEVKKIQEDIDGNRFTGEDVEILEDIHNRIERFLRENKREKQLARDLDGHISDILRKTDL